MGCVSEIFSVGWTEGIEAARQRSRVVADDLGVNWLIGRRGRPVMQSTLGSHCRGQSKELQSPARELRMALLSALMLLLFARPTSGYCATAPNGLTVAERTQIDALFKTYDNSTSPGCALGVMRNGHLAYARGYGMADLERHVPIEPTSLFDIGSNSKQFTAAATILLAQDGKLSLADEVRKYVPELPDYGAPLTIDDMLRHISGLRDYAGLLTLAGHSPEEVTTDAQALAIIARQRHLNFPTGTRYDYSNTGYFLLSLIVERASGKTLAQFARERIFAPLGMSQARFLNDHSMLVPNRALGYAPDDKGGFKNYMSNWQQTGDGAVQLSIEEALKWDENFYEPRVGGRSLVEQLQQPGRLANGEPITYARGLVVDRYRGLRRVYHGGHWVGYISLLRRFPQQHTSIAVFCNSEGTHPGAISDRVADIVLASAFTEGNPSTGATKSDAAPTSGTTQVTSAESRSQARFVGSYFDSSDNTVYQVVREGAALFLRSSGESQPLMATGPGKFVIAAAYPILVTFLAEGDGPSRAFSMQIGSEPQMQAARFAPVRPALGALQEYAGTYYSPELDVSWPLVVEKDRLVLKSDALERASMAGPLEPAMLDAFVAAAGFMRFTRDTANRIQGFDLSASRIQNIQFERRASQ